LERYSNSDMNFLNLHVIVSIMEGRYKYIALLEIAP
jgi:hypothetical protein